MVEHENYLANSLGNRGPDFMFVLGGLWGHAAILSTQFVSIQDIKCSVLLCFPPRIAREYVVCVY